MKCPKCKGKTEVELTRFGDTRTRHCLSCGHRFLTLETVVKDLPSPAPVKHRACVLVKGDETLRFPSASAAARFLGLDDASAARACRGERKTYAGYRWAYE